MLRRFYMGKDHSFFRSRRICRSKKSRRPSDAGIRYVL